MFSIIYPYRNRDLARVRNSFDSLRNQSISDFEVYFVDYGSSPQLAQQVKELCSTYSFITYRYYYTQFQPWNKCRALNAVIKTLKSGFCFVADVDMIFHPHFVKTAIKLQQPLKTIYFQVGFHEQKDAPESISTGNFGRYRKSTSEATGLSMFPVEVLKELHGFDEFYHFWGAEDTDMHVRIRNAGYEVGFFQEEVLMLHQWHKSYRVSEKKELSKDFQLKGIVQLNHQHLQSAIQQKKTKVNSESWGDIMAEADFLALESAETNFFLDNKQSKIDKFLFGELPQTQNGILKVSIHSDPFERSGKYWVKRILGKKVPEYYSLKEVNDKILLHLISFYRNTPYSYKIDVDLREIEVSVKFE